MVLNRIKLENLGRQSDTSDLQRILCRFRSDAFFCDVQAAYETNTK